MEEEDIGRGDLTSLAIKDSVVAAYWVPKENGIFCGGQLVQKLFQILDPSIEINLLVKDGETFQMGEKILLLIFAAVTLGGLGTAFGAMVGGLAIGFASETSTFWLDNDLKFLIALAVMIVILLVRPRGILGVRERLG